MTPIEALRTITLCYLVPRFLFVIPPNLILSPNYQKHILLLHSEFSWAFCKKCWSGNVSRVRGIFALLPDICCDWKACNAMITAEDLYTGNCSKNEQNLRKIGERSLFKNLSRNMHFVSWVIYLLSNLLWTNYRASIDNDRMGFA